MLSEIYSVGPIVAGCGMNITVWSYVDQLAISVLTDDLTLDDPHEACREKAIRGLKDCGDDAAMAVERMTELLSDPYDSVRHAAVECLPAIAGKQLAELTGHDDAYWARKYPRPERDPAEKRGQGM